MSSSGGGGDTDNQLANGIVRLIETLAGGGTQPRGSFLPPPAAPAPASGGLLQQLFAAPPQQSDATVSQLANSFWNSALKPGSQQAPPLLPQPQQRLQVQTGGAVVNHNVNELNYGSIPNVPFYNTTSPASTQPNEDLVNSCFKWLVDNVVNGRGNRGSQDLFTQALNAQHAPTLQQLPASSRAQLNEVFPFSTDDILSRFTAEQRQLLQNARHTREDTGEPAKEQGRWLAINRRPNDVCA
jgi:hypothetical protein